MLIKVESARGPPRLRGGPCARTGSGEDLAVVGRGRQGRTARRRTWRVHRRNVIQLHGGIGFTWEHDAHLFFKRAWTGAELLGKPAEHLEYLAAYLADSPTRWSGCRNARISPHCSLTTRPPRTSGWCTGSGGSLTLGEVPAPPGRSPACCPLRGVADREPVACVVR